MSFIESPRFPDVIGFTAVGGMGFSTSIVTLASGYEARNVNWSSTRYGYDLAIPVRSQSEVETINAFFRNAQGRANGFRFKDWTDYSATKNSTATLTSKTFQLQRDYVTGSSTNVRTIKKPVSASVSIYVNNVLQTTGFTVNYTTGVVTFVADPSGPVTWSGEFDVPVRFDVDALRWRVVDRGSASLLYQCEELTLVEVRL
jgi:uncharacterized protein (TIGR02217 family)